MIFLDLFSGIGGFALGAYNAGLRFERHYFSEIDPWCCKLYQKRFPDAVPLGDIKGIDGAALVRDSECGGLGGESWGRTGKEPSDGYAPFIIAGGFPCQDISVAGKGAGITGARSGLWFEYARLIGEIRPRYAIMENVGALTRRGLDAVLGSLAEIGYDAEWSDIRASDVGAPHRRERIWIVAYPQANASRSYTNSERSHREGVNVLGDSQLRDEQVGEPGSLGENVAYPEGRGQPVQRWASREAGHVAFSREGMADSDNKGLEGRIEHRERTGEWPAWSSGEAYTGDWKSGAGIRRVAHGVPSRVDRLRGLGNAIVPQIAEMIFRQIKANMEEEA